MSTQQGLLQVDAQVIHLQDLAKPRIADSIELVRLLRAVINAFRMYPPGNQMIQRSVERFARGMGALCDSLGQLVLNFASDNIEFNGEPVPRNVAESRLAQELAKIFVARGVKTVVYDRTTQVQEFAEWLRFISRQDVEDDDASFRVDLQQSHFPHLQLNRQVVTRHASEQVRDKLSVREIMASMDRDSLLKELGLEDEQLAPEFLEALEQPNAQSPEAPSEAMQGSVDPNVAKQEQHLEDAVRSGLFAFTLIKRDTRYRRERALRQTKAGASHAAGTSARLSTVPSRAALSASQGQMAALSTSQGQMAGFSGSQGPTTGFSGSQGQAPSARPFSSGSGMQAPPKGLEVLEGMPVSEDISLPRSGSRGLLEVLSEGIAGPQNKRTMEKEAAAPAPLQPFFEGSGAPLPWQGEMPAKAGGVLHTQGVTSVPIPLDPSQFLPNELFADIPPAQAESGFAAEESAAADPMLDALSNAMAQRQDLFSAKGPQGIGGVGEPLQLPSLSELLAAAERDTRAAQEQEMSVEAAEALARLLTWQEQLAQALRTAQPQPAQQGQNSRSLDRSGGVPSVVVAPAASDVAARSGSAETADPLQITGHRVDASTHSVEMFDVTRQGEESMSIAGVDVSGSQQDFGGFVDVTASLDHLSASDARSMVESRGATPTGQGLVVEAHASGYAAPLPSFDDIDWNQAANVPLDRWPKSLRIEEIVRSQRFGELMQQPNFPRYVQASLRGLQTYAASQRDPKHLVAPVTQQTIQEDLSRFGEAVGQIQEDALRKQFVLGVLQQIAALDESLIAQYWLQASSSDAFGKAVRRGLLRVLSPDTIQHVQRDLITKIQDSPNRELLESALSLSKDIVDAQLQTTDWRSVRQMVSFLEKIAQENPSRRIQLSLREMLGHLKTRHRMTHILREGMHPHGEEARALLAELAPESLPLCARFLIKSPEGPLREQQAEIFAQVALRADKARVASAFHIIFEYFDHHPPSLEMWQIFCDLARSCAPDILESMILDHLQYEQSPRSFHLWVTQALLHPSPRLQWWLDQCLRQRALAFIPFIEEMVFSAWARTQGFDASGFLRSEIFHANRPAAQRHHAVWMIGCLPPEEGRALFEEALFSPAASMLGEKLRFQLMYTLWQRGHGVWRRTMMQKLLADESPMIRFVAQALLQQHAPQHKPAGGGILPPDEILLAPVEVLSKIPLFQPMPPGAYTQEAQKIAPRSSAQTSPAAAGRPAASAGGRSPVVAGTPPPPSASLASPSRPSAGHPTTPSKTGEKRSLAAEKARNPAASGPEISGGIKALGLGAVFLLLIFLVYVYLSGP
ncbi:hypothetical protein L6R29_02240 [Myxococcota bacterium]|nr:hypothetical protein [Myxococcota bacterium]